MRHCLKRPFFFASLISCHPLLLLCVTLMARTRRDAYLKSEQGSSQRIGGRGARGLSGERMTHLHHLP